jgi:Rod binding domain-containing protein
MNASPTSGSRLSTIGRTAGADERQKAVEVAGQFEALFVRTLVSSLRQTSKVGGEGSMFGSGPGADTYADWFDQNIADQLGRSGSIGIASTLVKDMERHGLVAGDEEKAASNKLREALRAADRSAMAAAQSKTTGGIDVVR